MQLFTKMYILVLNHRRQLQTCSAGMTFNPLCFYALATKLRSTMSSHAQICLFGCFKFLECIMGYGSIWILPSSNCQKKSFIFVCSRLEVLKIKFSHLFFFLQGLLIEYRFIIPQLLLNIMAYCLLFLSLKSGLQYFFH